MTDPISRFITVVITLAVVATIVAGVLVIAGSSPAKNSAPQNSPQVQQQPDQPNDGVTRCRIECEDEEHSCLERCPWDESRKWCAQDCTRTYNTCYAKCGK